MTSNFIAHPEWAEWLSDISADLPCGPDLEYDPSFLLLEQAVSGRPEAEYGETVIAAVPPDWTAADALCIELLSRTRDLRVLACLARGRLVREGVAGLADGLAVIAELLQTHWEHVHPQLEPGDEVDATARINALAALVDTTGIIGDFLDLPIVAQLPSQTIPLTLREWTYATGETVVPAGRTILGIAEIEAALAAAVGRAVSVRDALDAAIAHAVRIEAVVTEHVGASQTIDLGPLTTLLRRARSLIGDAVVKFAGTDADIAAIEQDTETLSGGAPVTPPQSNQISTRADVIAMLDRVCEYYAHHEPSSPVPLLLKRARGLVHKSFIDLLGDLAPEGLAQLTQVVGTAGMSPTSE